MFPNTFIRFFSENSENSQNFPGIPSYLNLVQNETNAQIVVYMYRLIEVLLPHVTINDMKGYVELLLKRLVIDSHWRLLSCLIFCVGSVIKENSVKDLIVTSLLPLLKHEQLFIPLCVAMMFSKFAPSNFCYL
jgi:hypothetical protein